MPQGLNSGGLFTEVLHGGGGQRYEVLQMRSNVDIAVICQAQAFVDHGDLQTMAG
jgi:hypothetical protein